MKELVEINELTKKAYNKAASKYHEMFKDEMNEKEYDRNILNNFAKYFRPDDKIIDAGCGPSAHIGRYLFDKGLDVTGIDISEKCLEIAAIYNPKMKFRLMELCNLDFPENSLDGIISFYSIIHTPKKYINLIIKEFYRKLTPGGKLLLTVKKGNKEELLEEFLGYKTKIFFSNFNEKEIESYLTDGGFTLISLDTRRPYSNEISVDRIYAFAEKM
jgi:ubiquinone/menaquinone biosynthesis C-methylase UbiE